MKLTLIYFVTFFTLTFASSVSTIKSTSIVDSISQLLYIYLNPIFQDTLKQLTQLVFEFGDKLSQNIPYELTRSNGPTPAPWVSQLFGEVNSISTQWNNQVSQFFATIPTIFETNSRSSLNMPTIRETLYNAVEHLLGELKKLFIDNIKQTIISIFNRFDLMEFIGRKRALSNIEDSLNVFEQQVSNIFDKTKEKLNRTIDDAINFIITFWDDVKYRFLG
ncbi:unnamed protein product [Rotaria sp. Silwood1]|nr:unnamed protein product [Rotaria sp. Silwood1]CAF3333195.1 unnamed protein product [Rotaria sp. Silwood1]CAF3353255.1 unnamed protein product [Rotaria sp. Silwood1]CAF3354076.1 unnamed protein product [Rotaria sp. Silwood1]CAF3358846.1 unnamed protein product [Rotaria sp. Silwood1]